MAKPRSQILHHSYEKSGVTVQDQPIPWNADSIVIEATFRPAQIQGLQREDFELRLVDPVLYLAAERLVRSAEASRVFFRLPPMPRSFSLELRWQQRPLAQAQIPVLSEADFRSDLSLQMPTVAPSLSGRTIACEVFTLRQCQGLHATALLGSPTSLVPLVDLDLRVELLDDLESPLACVPLHLGSAQLRARQALVAAPLPRPRRVGVYFVRWRLGEHLLATHRLRVLGDQTLPRTLRISATRLIVQTGDGQTRILQVLPEASSLEDVARVGPCFLVCSNEPGFAGTVKLKLLAERLDGTREEVAAEQELFLTGGPTPFAPGMFNASELGPIRQFVLQCQRAILGVLPLGPPPTAHFTGEGGIQGVDDFAWSPAADAQLAEKLGKLLDERGA